MSALKRAILGACSDPGTPRTTDDLAAQFGEPARKCVNNLSLRKELTNINGLGVRPALWLEPRAARARLRAVARG